MSAHIGETYLTSGAIADAIGIGIPMLVNPWPFFRETLGNAAFYYAGTEAGLTEGFARISVDDISRGQESFHAIEPHFAWPPLSEQTLDLMRALRR